MRSDERLLDIVMRIALVVLLAMSLFPFYWMLMNSMKTAREIFQDPIGLPSSVSIANYLKAWTKADLATALANSAIVTGGSVIIVIVTATLAAYPLARMRFAGRSLFLAFFISGLVVAPEVVLVPLFNMFSTFHLLNTLWSVMLANAAFALPLSVFLFWQFFREIPHELQESSRVDGCSHFTFFRLILLPLSKPVLGSVTIFVSLFTWNEYLFALTFLRDNATKTIPARLQVFFSQFQTDWSALFAALVMVTLPIIILYLFMQRSFVRGLTAGAVKG